MSDRELGISDQGHLGSEFRNLLFSLSLLPQAGPRREVFVKLIELVVAQVSFTPPSEMVV